MRIAMDGALEAKARQGGARCGRSRAARAAVAGVCLALAACAARDFDAQQAPRGDPKRGRVALAEFECNACHVIPGVRGARGRVGPSLERYGKRVYVAGKFPNTEDVLARWVVDAPSLAPLTAMPGFAEMTEQQAYDIAAYLYSLE